MSKKLFRKKWKYYRGSLGKKIRIPNPPTPPSMALQLLGLKSFDEYEEDSIEFTKAMGERLSLERISKISDLFKHYDVDPNDDGSEIQLIMVLAERHVPGFQHYIAKDSGRKNKWDDIKYLQLFLDIEENRLKARAKDEQPRVSIEAICRRLIKENPWKDFITDKRDVQNPSKVLMNKYSEAQNTELVKMYLGGGDQKRFINENVPRQIL